MAVQSPDFEQVKASKLESIVEWMRLEGLPVEVLENQESLPSERADIGEEFLVENGRHGQGSRRWKARRPTSLA